MKKIFSISLIFLSLVLLNTGCKTKMLTKKGLKMEALGQYADAADMFYYAVQAKNTNIEAIAGLKRCGQMTLSKKLSEFNQAYNNHKNKEAVYFYQDAKAYYEKLNAVGATLNFPSFYEEYYEEVKDTYLEDRYYEGANMLDSERFSEAESIFREIQNLQANYKDSKDKLITAINEPKYREALRLMEIDQYRKAYYVFDAIISNAGAYKSSYDLKSECLTKGSISISIETIKNQTGTSGLEAQLESKIINNIQSANNPFIKLVDTKGSNAARYPDARLYVEIPKFVYNKGQNKEEEKKGYLKKTTKVMNKATEKYETKTEYSKVVYKEYSMSRSVDMNINFRLVDGKTSVIHTSSNKISKAVDNIHYAKYDGNAQNLVPGNWKNKLLSSSEDIIKDNVADVKNLQNLLNARTQIKDYNTLSSEAINECANAVSSAILQYVNQ
ncbi:MAG: hypothetical protein M0Q45_02480 [Bacteroidales bacterium]|nr:hypothetical protein [Bacteroidales bacterium]